MKKPQTQKRKIKHHKFTEEKFTPYAKTIGQIALIWNELHERLGFLFSVIMGFGDMSLGVWASVDYDRPKRKILKAAIKGSGIAKDSKMADDIMWIIEETNKIEDDRNNAIHAPLAFMNRPSALNKEDLIFMRGQVNFVTPSRGLMNNRAEELFKKTTKKGKGLLAELRLYRDSLIVLRDFTANINYSLSASDIPWPDRPSLPNRGQKKSQSRKQPHHPIK